jgi:hypothetical protein
MRKSTIFISTVLTTFALVMLYGVVSAYRNISTVPEVSALTANTETPEPTTAPTDAPTAVPTQHVLTPEEAAQLAAQVIGNTNLLSAESASINGADAYKITFTNNDVIYVGLNGQILGVQIAPVLLNVAVPAPTKHKDRNHNNDNTSVSNGGAEPQDGGSEHDD